MEINEPKNESVSKFLMSFNGFLVLSVIFVMFAINTKSNRLALATKNDTVKKLAQAPNVFENLRLEAKSVYVFDVVNNRVLFKKNEFAQLPLASITKLMMALAATEVAAKDAHITIKKEFLNEEGDSGLLVGESWKLQDLLDYSLIVSSNDGARSVASVIGTAKLENQDYDLGRKDFVSMMNQKAGEIGLKQTYFINEDGLDVGGFSGGYGSAIDVSKLMQYILTAHPEILEATKYDSLSVSSFSKTHIAKNTNIIINKIPGLLASKTGYTDMSGGNLVVVFDASIERPIVVVVLGSSQNGRFDDMTKLVSASQRYLRGDVI